MSSGELRRGKIIWAGLHDKEGPHAFLVEFSAEALVKEGFARTFEDS